MLPLNGMGYYSTLFILYAPMTTLKFIKEKIYGPGSSANLALLNPYVDPNRMDVGEKIYYNSPNRPNDETKMLFYYDDIGRQPQIWSVNSGENIRSMSQSLLGHPRSWMEVWATHPEIVSKGNLESSYSLRYFSDEGQQPPDLASNESYKVSEDNPPQAMNDMEGGGTVNSESGTFPEDPSTAPPSEASGLPNQAAAGTVESPKGKEPAFEEGFEDEFKDIPQGDKPAQVAGLNSQGNDQGFPKGEPNDPAVGDIPAGADEKTPNDFGMAKEGPVDPDPAGIGGIPEKINQSQLDKIKNDLMGLDPKMVETIAMGGGGILLLFMLLYVARRRRKGSSDVQEMDFTQINEPTKTRVDM